jgi:hypothetical protein
MFDVSCKITDETKKVSDAAERASFKNLGHAAASIRKTAQSEITTDPGPSEPGTPPHSRRGLLRRAIRYAADKDSAVIGPVAGLVGESAEPEEFGGEYKGENYPARPFMGPALEANLDRFSKEWEGSV